MKLSFSTTINDRSQRVEVNANQTLLELLRDDLKLKGTVEGCSIGVCGSCTVLMDGKPISSCLTLASNIEDRTITTIEGLAQNGDLDAVQRAFLKHQAFQCGFCTSGMILAVKGLLSAYSHPTEKQTRDFLSGNLCRCGTYKEVLSAIAELIHDDRNAT